MHDLFPRGWVSDLLTLGLVVLAVLAAGLVPEWVVLAVCSAATAVVHGFARHRIMTSKHRVIVITRVEALKLHPIRDVIDVKRRRKHWAITVETVGTPPDDFGRQLAAALSQNGIVAKIEVMPI